MTQTATPPAPVTQLNTDQINRYKRHLILPEVGMDGQRKLLNAKVLCIGAGGLGCPISLYEQQTHHLLCPCHQSTFDLTDGANVLFGPAARALPQLAITVDADGYLVARGDFNQPVGPSFWERG